MTATSVTLAGRQAAERLMVDTCTIVRRTATTTDPETGVVTPTTSQVYAGKCRIQHQGDTAGAGETGEATIYQAAFQLQLPMSMTGIAVEDRITVTASMLDAELVGRAFWVRGVAGGTHKTSRRYDIELVTG